VAGRDAEEAARTHGTPVFAHDLVSVREQAERLREAMTSVGAPIRIRFALKAQRDATFLRFLREETPFVGMDVCSPGEAELALRHGWAPEEISYTGTNVSDRDLDRLLPTGVHINVDLLSQLERFGRRAPGSRVGIRVNPGSAGGLLVMAPTQAASTPECKNGDLTATYKGGDAAMSHVYGRIVLHNTSDRTCWVQGYGGLSYVGGGNGTQIGAAADRTPSNKPRVTLKPGDKVRSAVVETSYAPYPRKKCKPRKVDGFRVYVPDETRSQFVAHPTTGCANPAVHLLAHKAYH